MKTKLFKQMSIAAAVLCATGCSSDDSMNAAREALASSAGKLFVTMEEQQLEEDAATTRSFLSCDLKTRMYNTADELQVYDPDMFRYDFYQFGWSDDSHQKGVFTRSNNPSFLKKDPTWALYPLSAVENGFWKLDKETGKAVVGAVMRIGVDEEGKADSIVYESTYQASDTEHNKPLYTETAPRWGKVTLNGNVLNTSLSFLTGLLRLQLADVPASKTLLRIQMLKGTEPQHITGQFTTVLAVDNEKQPGASLAADSYSEGTGATEMIVDLRKAPADLTGADRKKAVVFVPLVTTTEPVDIVVSASTNNGKKYTEIIRLKDKTISRAKVYGNSKEYTFTK